MATTAQDRLKRYLAYLDSIFAMEPEFHHPLESTIAGAPKVACMAYKNVPEPGHITGVTYGLSKVEHPKWRLRRPELIISVRSTDVHWPLAVAEVANQLRGRCPFTYGEVIDFEDRIAQDSEMSAFFVFAPSILERDAYLDIDVGGPQKLALAGMYPIYDSERKALSELGLDRFWHHPNFDLYDVRRPRIEAGATPSP
jgi:hypothetical protein